MDLRHPLNALWQPTGLAWCVIGAEALALTLALAPGIDDDRLVWFGLNSLVIQWISLSTLGLLYLGRHRLSRLRDGLQAAAGITLLLAATWLTIGSLWLGFAMPLRLSNGSLLELLLLGTSLALVVGLLAMVALQNHLRLQQLAVQATTAELQALQARIRPHFLFNTLNSAVALVRSEPGRAEDLLMDMADLFRAALSSNDHIELADELELCRRYLAIEQARFGARLQPVWQLPELLPSLQLPTLCLQPLLENAVHHGVEASHQPSTVLIQIHHQEDQLHLTVSNPLHGEHGQGRPGHGLGLQSVRARLARLPCPASLTTWQADGHFHARLHFALPDQVTTR